MITSATKLAKILASVEEKNKEFKKSTKPQQRVLVAQDVLAQIKAKRYVAEPGEWAYPFYSEAMRALPASNESAQKLFANQSIKTCHVCALGGLFMSCTNLNNNTTFTELEDALCLGHSLDGGEKLSNGLNRIFTKKQLILIESYFENEEGFFRSEIATKMTDHINLFNNKYPNPQTRLKEIMNNIVENNGTFVPSKLKVSKELSYFKLSGKEV